MKRLIVIILSFVILMCLGGCDKESASIGIIGGADGPTAVFVASNINWLEACGFIGVMVAAILVVLFIYRKNKK